MAKVTGHTGYRRTNKANPICDDFICSYVTTLFLWLSKDADAVEMAVKTVLKKGMRTIDIRMKVRLVGTKEMGDAIARRD